MAPAFLAGVFSQTYCEIRLYNEQYSGPLEDARLISWPDMLVLTGLNTAFDRMLHITAYARTKNRRIIVVAGGSAIRALPHFSKQFFDYCCTGDVEELQDVIIDALGKSFVSELLTERGWVLPRYDLTYWMGNVAYVESSRNCFFRCKFCSLTSEGGVYRRYDIEYLREQFIALGRQTYIMFLDNNFNSTNRQFMLDRFELLKELWRKKYFRGWGALVSSDYFLTEENLHLTRESGGGLLFSGIESFDRQALLRFNKYHNTLLPQVEMIRSCLNADIVFYYGLVYDISSRSIAEIRNELDFIVGTPDIPLPSYISWASPILGTPFFRECMMKGLLLPSLKLRDLDTTTITLKPIDPMPEVVRFTQDIQTLAGFKQRVMRHEWEFIRKYRGRLAMERIIMALLNSLFLCAPLLSTATSEAGSIALAGSGKRLRTYIGSNEPLDSVYKPAFSVDARYESYFRPTMLTDEDGNVVEALRLDLEGSDSDPKRMDMGMIQAIESSCYT